MIESALKYVDSNLSVIPVKLSTKQSLVGWKKYQTQKVDKNTLSKWFMNFTEDVGIAIICGEVSDYLEVIDLDNKDGDADKYYNEFIELVNNSMPGLADKLVIERTKSGGYHFFYKCKKIEGNQKLATIIVDGKQETLFETRGPGGYVVADPSPGYKLIKGALTNIQEISIEERDLLLSICKSYDQINIEDVDYKQNGDAALTIAINNFNSQELSTLLTQVGYKIHSKKSDGTFELTRPGKEFGVSATYNSPKLSKPNRLYVFSSNCYPFEQNKSYSNFAIRGLLEYNGDWKATAAALAQENGLNDKRNGSYKNKTVMNNVDVKVTSKVKISKTQRIEEYLNENFDLRFNTVLQNAEYSLKGLNQWEDVTDRFVNALWRDFEGEIPINYFESILKSDYCKDYHPFKEYFTSIPEWDGTDYIKLWIEMFPLLEHQKELFDSIMYKWFVAAVATAIERSVNHLCPVIVGAQGTYKTTTIDKTIPQQLKKYYTKKQLNPNDKDSLLVAAESFVNNLDELESITREEMGFVKSVITMEKVSVRRPYARRSEHATRHCSFIGSVNKAMFLTDMTGNRRFPSFEITNKIKWNDNIKIEQLWAQAKYLFDNDFCHWLSSEEIMQVNELNQNYSVIVSEEELLIKYFTPYPIKTHNIYEIYNAIDEGKANTFTATEIMQELNKQTNIRLSQIKLGQALKKNNFHSYIKKVGTSTQKLYLVAKPQSSLTIKEPF